MAVSVEFVPIRNCSCGSIYWISVPWRCVRVERYSSPSDIGAVQVGLYCFENAGPGYEATDEFGDDNLVLIIQAQSMN